MPIAETREALAQSLLSKSVEILGDRPPDRTRLDKVKAELLSLAGRVELWGDNDFPAPDVNEKQNRFQIAQDSVTGLTLYLNVMRPGKKIPPHDHTTWACVAAVEGTEFNTLYDRLDDGSVQGRAELKEKDVIELKPGNAVALLADDIHSVEIRGTDVIRHLHFYGQPLETLSGRTSFDLENGTCRIMDIGVKTKT